MLIKLDDGSVNSMIEALRLHAFDDCGGKDLPTHICNIAADMLAALRALPVSDGWEDMSSAPRDRTSILAIVAPNDSRHLEYHAGRMFVIRHEGVTDSDYDLGWAVFPGFGGAPDKYFAGWRPLPAPPTIE